MCCKEVKVYGPPPAVGVRTMSVGVTLQVAPTALPNTTLRALAGMTGIGDAVELELELAPEMELPVGQDGGHGVMSVVAVMPL